MAIGSGAGGRDLFSRNMQYGNSTPMHARRGKCREADHIANHVNMIAGGSIGFVDLDQSALEVGDVLLVPHLFFDAVPADFLFLHDANSRVAHRVAASVEESRQHFAAVAGGCLSR